MDTYKSVKIRRNPKMLKFVLDPVKAKKMCKHVVKKLPDPLRYVNDQNKAQQKSDKAILNGGTLKSLPDCYKNV